MFLSGNALLQAIGYRGSSIEVSSVQFVCLLLYHLDDAYNLTLLFRIYVSVLCIIEHPFGVR